MGIGPEEASLPMRRVDGDRSEPPHPGVAGPGQPRGRRPRRKTAQRARYHRPSTSSTTASSTPSTTRVRSHGAGPTPTRTGSSCSARSQGRSRPSAGARAGRRTWCGSGGAAARLDRARRHLQLPPRRRLQALRGRHPHRPPAPSPHRVPGHRCRRGARRGESSSPTWPPTTTATTTHPHEAPASPADRGAAPEAQPLRADTGPRVTVRPMRAGKGGAWIKTGASWRDIASTYGPPRPVARRPAPPQRAALKALMASGPPDLAYSNTQTVPARPVRPRALVPARTGGRGRRGADR